MEFTNKLTKNLGQARSEQPPGPAALQDNDVGPTPGVLNKETKARPVYLIGIMILIIALGALGLILQQIANHKAKPVIKVIPAPMLLARPVMAAPVPVTLTALVQAINVSGDHQNTHLTVFLNKAVTFSMTHDLGQNVLNLFLDNAQMAEPLLPFNTKNTLVQAITVNNVGSQLKISLALMPGAGIMQLHLDQAATPRLILDLGAPGESINQTTSTLGNSTLAPDALLSSDVLNKPGLQALANNMPDNALDDNGIEKTPILLTPEQRANQAYQAALTAIQNNQLPDAEQQLNALIKAFPTYTQGREALADLLIQQNNLAQASQLLQDGLQLQPNEPQFIQLQAQISLMQGNVYAALKKIQSIKPDITQYSAYYAFEAALYQRVGYSLKAAELYGRLVEMYPNNSVWWMGLGVALEGAGKKSAALEAYQNANTHKDLSFDLQNYVNSRISALGG
jgi:MSHA biogenesis protein MshN